MGLIGRLSSGQAVNDRPNSHIGSEVAEFLPRVLSSLTAPSEKFSVVEVDFGDEIIGKSLCVKTCPGDKIIYAQRPKRNGLSRFVKDREPEPTNKFVVILLRGNFDEFVLITAFFGPEAQPEPWDRAADVSALEFWNNHALIYNKTDIIPGTETCICPW